MSKFSTIKKVSAGLLRFSLLDAGREIANTALPQIRALPRFSTLRQAFRAASAARPTTPKPVTLNQALLLEIVLYTAGIIACGWLAWESKTPLSKATYIIIGAAFLAMLWMRLKPGRSR